jgi:sugar lactone lactonase YvrE
MVFGLGVADASAQETHFRVLAGASPAGVNDGSDEVTGGDARFNVPTGIAVDSSGTLYVTDSHNDVIRRITAVGAVTTFAGHAGEFGSANGIGSAALFGVPQGAAVDIAGNVYIADTFNHTIRKITPGGVVSTFAGRPGASGSA